MSNDQQTPSQYTVVTSCRCGGTLQLRASRTSGQLFLGCSNYPQCRETVAYDQLLAELAGALKETTAQLVAAVAAAPPKPRPRRRSLPFGWRIIPGRKDVPR